MPNKIILASGSPRRRELLTERGVEFEVLVTNADESVPDKLPHEEMVKTISKRKAEAAVQALTSSQTPDDIAVIAADTIVAMGDETFGKPEGKEGAKRMLLALSGNEHRVYTGVTVAFIRGGKAAYSQEVCVTKVKFRPLTEREIDDYLSSDEYADKAGAYAIQEEGGGFVAYIDGPYDNVVGLPVDLVLDMLTEFE